MSSSPFGEPSMTGAPGPQPEGSADDTPSNRRRLLVVGGAGVAGVLVACALAVPALLGDDPELDAELPPSAASATPVETAPSSEALPETAPVAVPVLTEAAARNPFLPPSGAGGSGEATDGLGSSGTDSADAIGAGGIGAGSIGPAGPAGPAGADGLDGLDGLDGVDGADGATGPAGPTGAAGAPAEYVSITYRGPDAAGTAGVFEVITRQGITTVTVAPFAESTDPTVQATGSLDPTGLTEAENIRFLRFEGEGNSRAVVRYASLVSTTTPDLPVNASMPYTLPTGQPLSLFVPDTD